MQWKCAPEFELSCFDPRCVNYRDGWLAEDVGSAVPQILLPVIVAIWSSPFEFPSTESSPGHRTAPAYLTDLHSVGLRQDHFWGVDNASEFVGLGPYTIQPLVQKILSILHSHDVHRTLGQPSDTLHPFQVWLVHILHGWGKYTVRKLRLASRIRYLNTAQNPSVSQPKGIHIKRESLHVLSLALSLGEAHGLSWTSGNRSYRNNREGALYKISL